MIDNNVQKQKPKHDEIQRHIDAFLDSGKMIEILTPESDDAQKPYRSYFNIWEH